MDLFDYENQEHDPQSHHDIPHEELQGRHDEKRFSKPAIISLFCGAGGLDEGFRQAGFETRLAYDIQAHCVETLEANHPTAVAFERDLSEIGASEIASHWRQEVPKVAPTGIIGGPPCQSFSRSNVYKKEEDPRDTLTFHYARILQVLDETFSYAGKPGIDFFLFENVPGLLDEDHRPIYSKFKRATDEAGYNVYESRLNALDFGVPQKRERVFVVGINRDTYREEFEFPAHSRSESDPEDVEDAIWDLNDNDPLHYSRSLTPEEIMEKTGHPNHWCMRPMSDKFDDDDFLEPGVTKGRSFRTLKWDAPSYTVAYGNREMHVHPSCERRVSILEAMRFQGFPDSYELRGNLSEQSSMVSDAVPPPLARALAGALSMQVYEDRFQEKDFEERGSVNVENGSRLSSTKEP